MICACCGYKITTAPHKTAYGTVCHRRWQDPNLFFPEKISSEGELQLMLESKAHQETNRSLQIPAGDHACMLVYL